MFVHDDNIITGWKTHHCRILTKPSLQQAERPALSPGTGCCAGVCSSCGTDRQADRQAGFCFEVEGEAFHAVIFSIHKTIYTIYQPSVCAIFGCYADSWSSTVSSYFQASSWMKVVWNCRSCLYKSCGESVRENFGLDSGTSSSIFSCKSLQSRWKYGVLILDSGMLLSLSNTRLMETSCCFNWSILVLFKIFPCVRKGDGS